MFVNYKEKHSFTSKEKNTLKFFASCAAISIKNDRLDGLDVVRVYVRLEGITCV